MATTRADLRRAIAGKLGDLRTFKATSDSPDGGSFISLDCAMESGTFASRDALCVSGGNADEARIVRTNIKNDRSLIFMDAFPFPFLTGDEIECYNYRGIGWHLSDYNQAINDTLIELQGTIKLPIVDDRGTTFSQDTPFLDIPDEFVWLEGVQFFRPYSTSPVWIANSNIPNDGDYLNNLGDWVLVDAAGYAGGAGWWIEPATGRIQIGGRWRTGMNGYAVRLIGRGEPAPMYDDADVTHANAAFLIASTAATMLARSMRNQISTERSQQAAALIDQAERMYPRVNTRLLPGAVRVR